MKAYNVTFHYFLLISCMANAQGDIDQQLISIKQEYELIGAKRPNYQKIILDKSKELYDQNEPDETIRKYILTFYLENNNVKLITKYELIDHMFVQESVTEFYFKDNDLIFVSKTEKEIEWEGYDNLSERNTKLKENSFYLNQKLCIKYLIRSVTGPLSKIENLLKTARFIEEDCSQMIDYYLESNMLISLIQNIKE